MTPAKLWLQIFLAGFLVIVGLLVVTLATPIPYGDLSRLGRVSDHDFGWQAPAPRVEERFLQTVSPAQADVLVIGDSFSMSGRWQSELVKSGLKVDTVFWGHFGEALCEDFDSWLAASGFKGKLVIIESVERLLGERLARSQSCKTTKRAMRTEPNSFLKPPELPPEFVPNWGATLMTGWITYSNTRRAKVEPGDTPADVNARVRPVPNGCELFSHRLCQKALFYGDDDDNGELKPEQVDVMRAFTERHAKTPILWMVIPNKTTVYVQPEHSKAFAERFAASGLGPDLFGFAMTQKSRIKDFYFPNDTHMSMHGQLALGSLMLQEVRKRVLSPSAGAP